MLLFTSLTLGIHLVEMEPHDAVAYASETDHGHGYAVTLHEAGPIGCWVDLFWVNSVLLPIYKTRVRRDWRDLQKHS